MPRYVRCDDDAVVIQLTGTEWAVAIDSLKRARAHPDPSYSPANLSSLTRTIDKFEQATKQLRRV